MVLVAIPSFSGSMCYRIKVGKGMLVLEPGLLFKYRGLAFELDYIDNSGVMDHD